MSIHALIWGIMECKIGLDGLQAQIAEIDAVARCKCAVGQRAVDHAENTTAHLDVRKIEVELERLGGRSIRARAVENVIIPGRIAATAVEVRLRLHQCHMAHFEGLHIPRGHQKVDYGETRKTQLQLFERKHCLVLRILHVQVAQYNVRWQVKIDHAHVHLHAKRIA